MTEQYRNGYKPTFNLRVCVLGEDKSLLQQEWVSDYPGFPPLWRFVPKYHPTEKEFVEWTT